MKKLSLALLVVAFAATGALATETTLSIVPATHFSSVQNDVLYDSTTFAPAKRQDRMQMAQAKETTSVQTSAPVTSTTVVSGGNLAAEIMQWIQVALVPTIGGLVLWLLSRGLNYIGVRITDDQKSQLQGIVVNGLNAAAARAQTQLRDNPNLDIQIKSQIVADAVDYAQRHGAETIRALGLDPKSGEAVEAIKARIQTALNDPATPTPAEITPPTGQPLAPRGV